MAGFRFEKKKKDNKDLVFYVLIAIEILLLLWIILGYAGILPLI